MSTTEATTDSRWFGGGYIYGLQNIAAGGQAPSVVLPSVFATIQEANIDISYTIKELRGAFEDPEDTANTQRKITGKIITGRMDIQSLNYFAFGEGLNTGTTLLAPSEQQTIPSSGSYQVTVSNAANFNADLGVWYYGTRTKLQPASSSPGVGQYSYSGAGVYTFNVADAGKVVLISYRYTSTSSGHNMIVHNLIMGSSARPAFQALFQNPNDGDQEIFLYQCRCSKVSIPIKSEDYVKLGIDFQAYANLSNQVIQFLSSY